MSLSLEQFKRALPEKCRKSVKQSVVDQINKIMDDPEMHETYREHLLSYMSVLEDGRFKLTDYISAVKYCSLRLAGATQNDAFMRTFPDRYQRFVDNNTASKDIASYVTSYNKSKLVNIIMEQSRIPTWVLNQDLFQKAINVQAELMMTSSSDKVRSDAANSLMIHLKPPETFKVELDVGQKQVDAIAELNKTLMKLSSQQQGLIHAGVSDARTVAESRIIEGESHDVAF